VLSFLYALFYIILGHAYMATEVVRSSCFCCSHRLTHTCAQPGLSVLSSVGGYNSTVQQALLYAAMQSGREPAYCNSSSAVHWDFGPGLEWQSPQCVAHLRSTEFSWATPEALTVHTNFVQQTFRRDCDDLCTLTPAGVCAAGGTLLDPEYDSELGNNYSVQLLTFPSNCSTRVTSYANAYIYGAESVSVTLKPVFTTSWGTVGNFSSLSLVDSKGASLGAAYVFTGGVMELQLQDLLDAAGVSLDDGNANSGGRGLSNVSQYGINTNSATEWPPYRTTGLVLRVRVHVSNFRTTSPVNFNTTAVVSVVPVSVPGTWFGAPSSTSYMGSLLSSQDYLFDSVWTERRWQSVRVEFGVDGVLGRPDAFTALSAIISAFVVAMIAVSLTDVIGQVLSQEFAAEKFEDTGQRTAVETFLMKEADHGVPFNFEDLRLRQANGELSEECYESAIFRLEKEIDELRTGGAKVRNAAALIAEELNMGQLLDESGPPPAPVYKLMEDATGDEILVYPGDNVIGRGLGQIKAATISRKQMCITVDPESVRAFVRSMRADKSPSIPAIKRSGSGQTNWRALSQKGQSLSLGDTICLQIKPAAPGKEPGTISEYRFVPLDAPPSREPTLIEKMRKMGLPF